jgi:hypothetical protein
MARVIKGAISFGFAVGLLGSTLVSACEADAPGPAADVAVGVDAASERAACEGGARGQVVGCAEGALVDSEGAPVVGVRVAACTAATCITGTSDAAGRFAIQGLPVAPHKFEALAVPKGFLATVFFADVTGGRMVGPGRPVVLPRLPEPVAFNPAAGGTVTLADGAVVLEAAPGALGFPIGTAEGGIAATFISGASLPDYDLHPWGGREAETFAVAFHPFPLKAEGSVVIALAPPDGVGDGPWDLHAVNGSSARITRVGPLEPGDDGLLRLEEPATLVDLTVLVAVPR